MNGAPPHKQGQQKRTSAEGPIVAFVMGQLACALFAIPTAAMLWSATNRVVALWGPSGAFVGAPGFWLMLGFFACVSVFLPKIFPSLLGKVWHLIVRLNQWF